MTACERPRAERLNVRGEVQFYRVYTNVEVRIGARIGREGTTHLLETNSIGLLAEALTAEVKTVLADETGLVGAVTAAQVVRISMELCVSSSLRRE